MGLGLHSSASASPCFDEALLEEQEDRGQRRRRREEDSEEWTTVWTELDYLQVFVQNTHKQSNSLVSTENTGNMMII